MRMVMCKYVWLSPLVMVSPSRMTLWIVDGIRLAQALARRSMVAYDCQKLAHSLEFVTRFQ